MSDFIQTSPVVTDVFSEYVPLEDISESNSVATIDGVAVSDKSLKQQYFTQAIQSNETFFTQEFFPFFEKMVLQKLSESREHGDVYRSQGAYILLADMKRFVSRYSKPVVKIK